MGENGEVEGGLGVFDGFFAFGFGIEQGFGVFQCFDLVGIGGEFEACGDAGLGDFVLVVERFIEQTVFAAVFF